MITRLLLLVRKGQAAASSQSRAGESYCYKLDISSWEAAETLQWAQWKIPKHLCSQGAQALQWNLNRTEAVQAIPRRGCFRRALVQLMGHSTLIKLFFLLSKLDLQCPKVQKREDCICRSQGTLLTPAEAAAQKLYSWGCCRSLLCILKSFPGSVAISAKQPSAEFKLIKHLQRFAASLLELYPTPLLSALLKPNPLLLTSSSLYQPREIPAAHKSVLL